jgi:DNA-binding NarL/FixJ family response regulator
VKRGQQQSRLRAGTRIEPLTTAAGRNAVALDLCDDQPMRRTVLIVDDHDGFRESATSLLEAEGFAVVGAVAGGDAALAAVERLRPEVVLLDVQLPDLDGFTVAERLAATPDPPSVVLISSREAAAYGPRLQAARARGFIPKGELTGDALRKLVD